MLPFIVQCGTGIAGGHFISKKLLVKQKTFFLGEEGYERFQVVCLALGQLLGHHAEGNIEAFQLEVRTQVSHGFVHARLTRHFLHFDFR